MTWATISTRQMVLKNRINTLESQLIDISQQLQTAYDDSAYNQQINQMDYSEKLEQIQNAYQDRLDALSGNDTSTTEGSELYTKQTNEAAKLYLTAKKMLDQQLNTVNTMEQHKTDAKTKALEAQQEQIETQLEASRAEYDQLDKACSNDIGKGAIKLVSQG